MDLLLSACSSVGLQDSHELAIANALAQAEAFALGYTESEALAELQAKGLSASAASALAPHKVHLGNRPSSLLLFARLDPATLGKLVALYEHKVFVESVLWDINAFDQWGVELGKQLADRLTPAVRGQGVATEPSIAAILARLSHWNR
jgi:glucose-6-phosphate isomerase